MARQESIVIEGARQNNLKNLSLRLPLNELIVITGLSGSGKSSLAFDTIYAEGQRRYVETFSPYARQFLDRMDKPMVDRVAGIPPAIAIDQTNPVRTSRSTVGTMTELNDYIKLLFARVAELHCRCCGRRVQRDAPQNIVERLLAETSGDPQPHDRLIAITFPVTVPHNFTRDEVRAFLSKQGYTRIHRQRDSELEVIQDRLRVQPKHRERLVRDFQAALAYGRGRASVRCLDAAGEVARTIRFSADLHCPDCDIHYRDAVPNLFSFNSPIGACESCRGFGRTIGIDYGLVVPDETKSLLDGAVKPWQSKSYRQCHDDLLRFAQQRTVPTQTAWRKLSKTHKRWVLEGEGDWDDGVWYGVRRFFDWLETKSYKMHIRVLLSKYRTYRTCSDCGGTRLKPEALLWRLAPHVSAEQLVTSMPRFQPHLHEAHRKESVSLPGLSLPAIMGLPIERALDFFERFEAPAGLGEATKLLRQEIHTRLAYLMEVGLGYLTLDRQSRTLSGGEVQRINLTTALGTSLVNTLFVLDEPSIGLHPRDTERLLRVLRRLRDSGNSLILVEHDRQLILAADRILDLGPGPGELGGKVMFFGTPTQLSRAKRSLTAQYLTGEKAVRPPDTGKPQPPAGDGDWLEILGASEHNLKNIDVRIPLQRLVCVTGVSGSGKSTLVQNVAYKALRKHQGNAAEAPGRHRALRGHHQISEVVLVDQSPIGKTTRSTPVSYVGALDGIRKLFGSEPLARERGYTAGTFSFNSGDGRCPTCGGNGFEHIEMQFLSDVYLRCTDCNGTRFRPEILDVKLLPPSGQTQPKEEQRPPIQRKAKSIADVLDMTVQESLQFFQHSPEIGLALEPIQAVGLHYLRLGQPVPTLSGGEAQRLKLAGHLAKSRSRRNQSGSLFFFDEPTTGLHFGDIVTLLEAFHQLLDEGHSLVVIEHNLDVVRVADWIIDLGPEGGDAGGEIVCAGTPADVEKCEQSFTGAALRQASHSWQPSRQQETHCEDLEGNPSTTKPASIPAFSGASDQCIHIHNAREHNLKGVDVRIPRNRFSVITGISGSGKSTLAFDILFAEGQRRYLESLNAYARQFVQPVSRPDVDTISGIPPTIAIEQRSSRGGRKSTVATMTEIYHFLRLLFVKLGVQHCPLCSVAIKSQTRETILAAILQTYREKHIEFLAPLVKARKGYYTEQAKWAAHKGFSHLRVDGERVPTDKWPRLDRFKEHDIDLPVGALRVSPTAEAGIRDLLQRALDVGKGMVKVAASPAPKQARSATGEEAVFSTERACPRCARSFDELDPRLFSFNSRKGWCTTCYGSGLELAGFDAEQSGEEVSWNKPSHGIASACPACHGQRLCSEALAVRFQGRSIAEMNGLTVRAAQQFFNALDLSGREAAIAETILAEVHSRLGFLMQVGLPYLTLDRAAPSLSGGEAQRIRLAAQLGSNLRGVCYVLDEPTIGLHPRDNHLLLDTLQQLERKGNTVVVVEHDEETIRRAEYVVDLGPGAGVEGGRLVAAGSVDALCNNPNSVTGRFLANPVRHPLSRSTPNRPGSNTPALIIADASAHNLQRITVRLPLQRLVCVTGVSGSGKSTLVRNVLYENLARTLKKGHSQGRNRQGKTWRGCSELRGWRAVGRVLQVDQTPIGKTPRSCPATYVGFWDEVRRLYAETPEARMAGYGPGQFSFNLRGGRCEACEGQGVQKMEMSFLPDVRITCDACGGMRFGPETLAIKFKERSIGDVLAMSVEEASQFFAAHHRIHHALRLLRDMGLSYLTLGQQSPTLSGGEAQRIKLVTELAKTRFDAAETRQPATERQGRSARTLYVLDEPTIGLHMADVENLLQALRRLVAAGNTVVIIEHNLDMIAEADWIIDLGPEGGDDGGTLVAEGTPRFVSRLTKRSHTGKALARLVKERNREGARRLSRKN